MIWANTERVGCATTICHSNSPFGSQFGSSWTFTVCRYSPQGNYIGEHPLKAIGGEGKCGSCARSAKQESDLWAAEGDDFQVCVPPSGDEKSAQTGCVCQDATLMSEGACVPPSALPCAAPPVKCADGKTIYPRPPSCVAECAVKSDATCVGVTAAAAAATAATATLVL